MWEKTVAWKDVVRNVMEDGRLVTEQDGDVGKLFDKILAKYFGHCFYDGEKIKIVLKTTKDKAYKAEMLKDKIRCWRDGNAFYSVGSIRSIGGNYLEIEELEETLKNPLLSQFIWQERAFISHTKYLDDPPFDVGDVLLLKIEKESQ